MPRKSKLLYNSAEWDFDAIRRVYDECDKIAKEELKLDIYENQIEMISSEQMLDAYTSVGMPIMYNHWSFGKHFVQESTKYKRGQMGLAYEIVINSDPCISYLMEENTMTMQTLVIAHAAFGHNYFFKNNYLFKEWTDASGIIPYLSFAKRYISECEEKYGEREVELILNSCHALKNHGVNKYKRPPQLSVGEEKLQQQERQDFLDSSVNHLWRSFDSTTRDGVNPNTFPEKEEENILYFMEKHAPNLEPWQREIIRIVRKVAQYFYPQPQTKTMNEGCATYVHYYIMNRLYDKGKISDGNMKEFLISHTNVVHQPDYDDVVIYKDENGEEKSYSRYNGINPYALGFDMLRDMERMCKNPTEEDKYYMPEVAGTDWLETFHYSMQNFRDESFIRQYLSPTMVRKWKMFVMNDDADESLYKISAIQDQTGFNNVRNALAEQHMITNYYPEIKITNVDIKGDRSMLLTHQSHDGVEIGKDDIEDMMKHLYRLWGYNIKIESYNSEDGSIIEEFETDFSDVEEEDDEFPF